MSNLSSIIIFLFFGLVFSLPYPKRNLIFSDVEYDIKYFPQTIDHFTYKNQATFPMRYLENKKYWKPSTKSPIFFYCGNEADITLFYANSGFLTKNLAPEFNALLLFAEHRYFGQSMPFGNQSESYKPENNIYLTVEQALTDYVQFLKWYTKEINCLDCPIIAFGGSYGGMLAAWLRMKFPNVINAAIASSAPILYFKDVTPLEEFYRISTYNFQRSNISNCDKIIKEAYRRLENYGVIGVGQEKLNNISKNFNLCKNLNLSRQLMDLEDWLTTGYTYMAMTNYPYESNFLKNMPGWPCNASCHRLGEFAGIENLSTISDEKLFQSIYRSIKVYYDYEDKLSCFDIYDSSSSSNDDMSGWNILACNTMAMPMESDGIKDMFSPRPWNYDNYTQVCNQTYGQIPRYDWAIDFFGGRTEFELKQYSRIFFANGKLDPWSGGSPLRSLSKDIIAYYMEDSAHHLDLREPNDLDPQDVIVGRNLERIWIKKWLKEFELFSANEENYKFN